MKPDDEWVPVAAVCAWATARAMKARISKSKTARTGHPTNPEGPPRTKPPALTSVRQETQIVVVGGGASCNIVVLRVPHGPDTYGGHR